MVRQILILFIALMLSWTVDLHGQIRYIDFNPDIHVGSWPSNANDTAFVDVNQDSVYDFEIRCDVVPYMGHYCHLNYIKGIDSLNKIIQDTLITGTANCVHINYDSGFCAGPNLPYLNLMFFWITLCTGCNGPQIPKYFPFEMNIAGDLHYGWFRLRSDPYSITVYDMAINLTPNECITTGDTTSSHSGIETSFSIFPNPTKGGFTLSLKRSFVNGKIEIFNILGKNLYNEFLHQTLSQEFTLKDFSKGIYFVRVSDGVNYFSKKLIVE